ncbi:T9SS type A sorting domain-containing protein [Patescibacteria group bacterium]|nr:T9SS type A sorting domain-containing protein [Patescibacteria group bacterium]
MGRLKILSYLGYQVQSLPWKRWTDERPTVYNLSQNYPNPFNPTTVIEYSIKNDELVNLTVYDILGKTVAHAVNNFQKAGTYKVNFDAADLASGIYFYEIRSGGFYDVKKMILIR